MTISIIVAVADNGVIGYQQDLPWHIRADLRRFKKLTTGHHLIIGRHTWESVGTVLPGRHMIVVTSRPGSPAENLDYVGSIDEALRVAADDDEVFIGGGYGIYKEALGIADRIYLTRIHAAPRGDTVFPDFDRDQWRLVSSESFPADDANEYPFSFEVFERRHN